jgi:hypothetical protein
VTAGCHAAAYRFLSYYFELRSESAEVAAAAGRLLAPFAVEVDPRERRSPPTPGLPASYEVVAADGASYDLRYCERRMLRGVAGDVALGHLLWHVNAEAARQTGDFLLIHAGAAVTPDGGAVLVPAASGSGKTTLVAGLVRAGFGYLTDEAAPIDPVTRLVHPHPKALAFKRDPTELFEELRVPPVRARGQWHVLPDELRAGSVARASPVRLVVAFTYREGAPTEVTPLSRGATLLDLARNAMNLRTYGARALPLLADALAAASGCRLVAGSLDEAVGAVAALASGSQS